MSVARPAVPPAGGRAGDRQFLADPRVRPLPPFSPCPAAACTRAADSARGYCNTHYQRWRVATKTGPDLDAGQWRQAEPAVAEDGQVSLHGLPPMVVVQVLFGICQRARGGAKITDTDLRVACRALVRQQVTSIEECDSGSVPGKAVRSEDPRAGPAVRKPASQARSRRSAGRIGPRRHRSIP